MLHWPGEVDDYWRYSRNSEAGGHSWPSVFRFVAQFWAGADLRGGLLSVGLVVAAALLALTARAPTRPLALALVGTAVLSTVLLVIYAKRGIDDLSYRYVAEFYVTAPVSVLLVVALVGLDRIDAWRFRDWGTWTVAAGLAVGLLGTPEMKARYPGADWLAEPEQFLDARVDPATVRVMRFPLDVWPTVAGIVELSRRSGDRVCIEEPGYGFLFDESMVCTAEERRQGVVVQALPPGQTAGATGTDRYSGDRVVLELLGTA